MITLRGLSHTYLADRNAVPALVDASLTVRGEIAL